MMTDPIADFLTLAARTAPELAPGAISLFLVELPNPGIVVTPLKKEGIRASDTGLIHISDAFVPDDCLLGGQTGTYPVILDSLSENRVGVAANALGMAQAALEAALDYAKVRKVRGKTIGQYQAIAHKLADMAADIEAARWLCYRGLWLRDNGNNQTRIRLQLRQQFALQQIKPFASRQGRNLQYGCSRFEFRECSPQPLNQLRKFLQRNHTAIRR